MKNKLLLLSSFVLFAASLPINQSQTYFVDSLDDASLKEKIKITITNKKSKYANKSICLLSTKKI